MKSIFCILIMLVSFLGGLEVNAQAFPTDPEDNFFEVQKLMKEKFDKNPEAKGYKQWKRKEWFLEPRMYPSGTIQNLAAKSSAALNEMTKSSPTQRSVHGNWIFLGPEDHNITGPFQGGKGRINVVEFHPTNSQIIYAGTSQGGLWKTINGGNSWTNITPRLPLLAVADVVLDPISPNTIYLVTGDPIAIGLSPAGHTQIGSFTQGILRSTNGGLTWNTNVTSLPGQPLPFSRIYKLIIHPTNPLIQIMATSNGIYYTNNAWSTMTLASGGKRDDVVFKPGNPNTVYASGLSQFSRSTDGGLTWTIVSDPNLPFLLPNTFTALAVTPDAPNLVYFMFSNSSTGQTILSSNDSGQDNSWTVMDITPNIVGGNGFYNLAMTLKPTDANTVCIGKVFFGRSTNGGQTGSWTTSIAAHNDIHELIYNNGNLYCANDGGLYRSSNDGNTWTEISKGIGNTEIYRMSGTPQNNEFYVIGAQDIGTLKRTSNSATFTTFAGADGMDNLIDYTDQDRIIISGQNGNFFKTETGGAAQTNITPGLGGIWVTPAVMDPVNPNIIFIGKDTMFRSTNFGDSWVSFDSPSPSNLNCVEQGINNRNRMYVSRIDNIWTMNSALSANGTVTWTDITDGLPNLFITDIIVDPNNAQEVYVTLSGYDDGDKVYRSSNAGIDWTNISGNLPNIPINCIAYHDNGSNLDNVYIGTDVGVFYRNNAIAKWVYFSNEMPSVAVTDFFINTNNNTITAATYGRGLWRSDLLTPCIANLTINTEEGGTKHYSASNTITSTAVHFKDIGTDIKYSANNYIDLKEGFLIGGHAMFLALAGDGCPN